MINTILFVLIVLAIIIISIMYLKSLQVNTSEVKYNIVMRFLMVCLLSIIFLENSSQSTIIKNVYGSIETYLSDAGKTMMDFIDIRTKDIDNRLDSIDNRMTSIDKNIDTINNNITNSKKDIIEHNNSLIDIFQKYIDKKIEEFIISVTPLGPGGIRTIW